MMLKPVSEAARPCVKLSATFASQHCAGSLVAATVLSNLRRTSECFCNWNSFDDHRKEINFF